MNPPRFINCKKKYNPRAEVHYSISLKASRIHRPNIKLYRAEVVYINIFKNIPEING